MAEGRQRDNWSRWAFLIAQVLNGPCERQDKRPWQPDDINPFAKRRTQEYVKVSPGEFIDLLTIQR